MQLIVSTLIKEGITTFYAGMALGVNTWAAELVLELRKQNPELKLIAALPCKTQADRWLPTQRNRYFNLLPRCDDVIYISRQYTPTCMLDRNRYMVDHSQHLIAVYDGQYKGGTAFTIRYARQNRRDVFIIPTSNTDFQKQIFTSSLL
ncbi:MAG: DUF1273 domain-containing protein [Clostridiales bacterium]|nr:DUF1273 domain-containing protein [Clostridiales bacterium]